MLISSLNNQSNYVVYLEIALFLNFGALSALLNSYVVLRDHIFWPYGGETGPIIA